MKQHFNAARALPGKLAAGDIAAFFHKTSLLSQIPADQLAQLAQKAKARHFPKGSVIFRAGEPANWLHFLYEGYVAELVSFGSSENIIVKTRKQHDYIGEMGILSSSSYPNSAVAMGGVTLISLSREVFLQLLDQYPCVSRCIILQLIERLTNSAKKMVSTMHLDAPTRLAFTIVSLSGDMAGKYHDMDITQNDLAAASGMARQTVARILGEWRKKKWIDNKRGRLSVLNVDALLGVIDDFECNH